MPLKGGSRLGHYDVTAQIGQGGMGEVYRAHDTKRLSVSPWSFVTFRVRSISQSQPERRRYNRGLLVRRLARRVPDNPPRH